MKNRIHIKLHIIVGIGLFLLLLAVVWYLLMVRMDVLLTETMEEQVSMQVEQLAIQLDERITSEMKNLERRSDSLSQALEINQPFDEVMKVMDNEFLRGKCGILELDGNAVYGEALDFSEFPGIKDAFHGNSAVTYNETRGFLFTAPVYKGSNVKYVIYMLHEKEMFTADDGLSCFGGKWVKKPPASP